MPADLLVRDGRVEACVPRGSNVAAARTIDLKEAVVTPGLVDAHVHLLLAGEALAQVDLSGVRSRDAFEAAIATAHAELPEGQWLIATGWNDVQWGGELPTRDWLRKAEDRPAVCWRCDWHSVLVNDAVLGRLDLERRPPAGGKVVVGTDGHPSGLLVESAAWEWVNPILPPMPEAARSAGLDRALTH